MKTYKLSHAEFRRFIQKGAWEETVKMCQVDEARSQEQKISSQRLVKPVCTGVITLESVMSSPFLRESLMGPSDFVDRD